MLGNDIVDLRDPDTDPETFRPRFDARVYAPVERRAIERDVEPHSRRWAHWAAKEAAYKLAKQIDPDFVFSPSKLVARFKVPLELPGDQVERCGTLTLPHAVAPGIAELELRSFETPDRVHVLALPKGSDWEAVVSGVESIETRADPSRAVRDLARIRIARDLGIEPERVSIGRRGRIPTVEIDGSRSTMAISISHHGRWVAFATTLRCEDSLSVSRVGPASQAEGRGAGRSALVR